MRIVLLKERPISWNKMYAGMHWSKRGDEVERVHQMVRFAPKSVFKSGTYTGIDGGPYHITITAYFDKRPYDADNIAAKLYIDGLKGIYIINDTPKYVSAVTTRSKVDKHNPRVEIELEKQL